MTTVPSYFLVTLLHHAGWPRKRGLLVRREVIISMVLVGALRALVQAAIAIGACRPRTAAFLLADAFRTRDWSKQPPTELWDDFDPSDQIAEKPGQSAEEIIIGIASPYDSYEQFANALDELIDWSFVKTNNFSAHVHLAFAQGLIWGISHPEEALARHEQQRRKHLAVLDSMVAAGLDVHSPETLEECADAMEEVVDLFQQKRGRFAEVPSELLAFHPISARLGHGD